MAHRTHRTQKLNQGYGPTYHRIYSIEIPVGQKEALEIMRDLQKNPNSFSPQVLARFEKTKGSQSELNEGDEFQIHITGPWNGPVRVTKVNENQFGFATIDGHLEAGEIHFQIQNIATDTVIFQIESRARSRDAIVDLVYDKLPIAKLAQTEMWKIFCQQFAEKALERKAADTVKANEVQITTEKYDEETKQWHTL